MTKLEELAEKHCFCSRFYCDDAEYTLNLDSLRALIKELDELRKQGVYCD